MNRLACSALPCALSLDRLGLSTSPRQFTHTNTAAVKREQVGPCGSHILGEERHIVNKKLVILQLSISIKKTSKSRDRTEAGSDLSEEP